MMKSIDIDIAHRPKEAFRDPWPEPHLYQDDMQRTEKPITPENYQYMLDLVDTEEKASKNQKICPHYVRRWFERWHLMYAVGEPLARCLEQMREDLLVLLKLHEFKARRWGVGVQQGTMQLFGSSHREELTVLSLWCLLEPDPARFGQFMGLHYKSGNWHIQALDFLLDAFLPGGMQCPAKYGKVSTYHKMWEKLTRALTAEGREARSQGMAQYMAGWNRLMKPLGWKPRRVYCARDAQGQQIDPKCWGDMLFDRFAFEAALAVCALDLDDSAFRDHPYYPRDLVDHYRANVRQQRDGWRAVGAQRLPLPALPPPPRKSDLASHQFKGLERWIELACDGNLDAHAAVLEALEGAPSSLEKCSEEAVGALIEAGQCLCADLKDDLTAETRLEDLLEDRGLGGQFDADIYPGQGPARAQAVFDGAQAWLKTGVGGGNACRLLILDMGWDSWYALLIAQAHLDEFLALGEQLGFTGKIKC